MYDKYLIEYKVNSVLDKKEKNKEYNYNGVRRDAKNKLHLRCVMDLTFAT